jgi:hypothetical protein
MLLQWDMGKLNFLLLLMIVSITNSRCLAMDPSIMTGLQGLLTTENEQRVKLDKTLVETMEEMKSTPLNASQVNLLETSLLRSETKIADIKRALTENHMRIEFLNAFISSMDSSKDARIDAPRILGEMAHKEILESVETNNDQKTWVFEIYLSIAIKEVMEPNEKFTEFVKSYINYSSLNEPRNPGEFSKSRNYLGGTLNQKISNPTED